MDPIGDDLLRVMEPELGYRERAGQHTTFGEWYSTSVVQDPQYRTAPWCDMVIAWAADKAGVADFVGQFAWTPSHARWFETRGAWSGEPEPGALVFFDWSGGKDIKGIDHVGVVERVDGGTIHTIEGNVDGVWLRRKTRDESKVVGYGLPRKVKERLTGTSSGEAGLAGTPSSEDATVPQAAGRIEVRPAPAPGAVAAARPGTPAIPLETAPVAGVLLLVLAATLVLARRRARTPAAGPPAVPAAGRHRRQGPGTGTVTGPDAGRPGGAATPGTAAPGADGDRPGRPAGAAVPGLHPHHPDPEQERSMTTTTMHP
ncbi:CHAP domain-containing protein, partial [Streptosporangium sp. NPDC003464]